MSEAFGNDLDVNALLEQLRRVRVPQSVQADMTDAGPLRAPTKFFREITRAARLTLGVGEYQIVLVFTEAQGEALFGLFAPMIALIQTISGSK